MADKVQVEFLGSGDAFGSGGRFQACISLGWEGKRYLLDCGTSSLIAMRSAKVRPNEVEAILISHLHGDHFGGIPFFLLDAQLVSERKHSLTIAGPPGLEDRVHAAMEALYANSTSIERDFETTYQELEPGKLQKVAGIAATPFPVPHSSGAPSYGYRVQCGDKIIAYSGDTAWTDDLFPLSHDADLFICECYFYENANKNHLDYQMLISRKSDFTCKQWRLTHMNEDVLDRIDELEIEPAHDGMRMAV